MVKKKVAYLLLTLCMLILTCMDIVSIKDNAYWEQFGLKCVKLNMSEDDYIELLKQEQVNEWVAASLEKDEHDEYVIVRRHGNSSRVEPKISLKCKIGNRTVVYSGQYYDTSFCRYRLTDFLYKKAGFKTAEIEPILFFINDNFLGLYLEREAIDSAFFYKNNFNIYSAYLVNSGGELTFANGMNIYCAFKKKIPEDDISYHDLEKLITTIDKGVGEDNIDALESILDIYNALDYYAISLVTNSYDCIRFNYYLIYNLNKNKFEFIPWDLDRTFKNISEKVAIFSNGLFEKLEEHPPYKVYLEKRKRELFNKEELLEKLYQYKSEIEDAYAIDPILTGKNGLNREIFIIEEYIRKVDGYLNSDSIMID